VLVQPYSTVLYSVPFWYCHMQREPSWCWCCWCRRRTGCLHQAVQMLLSYSVLNDNCWMMKLQIIAFLRKERRLHCEPAPRGKSLEHSNCVHTKYAETASALFRSLSKLSSRRILTCICTTGSSEAEYIIVSRIVIVCQSTEP